MESKGMAMLEKWKTKSLEELGVNHTTVPGEGVH